MHRLCLEDLELEYCWVKPTNPRADAPVIVLLHEGLGCISMWKDFPQQVATATGLPCLVYSREGYGSSSRFRAPRQIDYLHHEALVVLPEVLQRFAIERPLLLGHSDGASIALIYAGANLAPVSGVIAMAPHVFVEEITLEGIREARQVYLNSDLPQRLERYHRDVEGVFWAWNNTWLSPEFRDWNIENYLPSISAPVLVLQGADDQYGSQAQLDAIASQVSGPVQTMMLPACGHTPQRDQPAQVLAAIQQFSQTLSA